VAFFHLVVLLRVVLRLVVLLLVVLLLVVLPSVVMVPCQVVFLLMVTILFQVVFRVDLLLPLMGLDLDHVVVPDVILDQDSSFSLDPTLG